VVTPAPEAMVAALAASYPGLSYVDPRLEPAIRGGGASSEADVPRPEVSSLTSSGSKEAEGKLAA